MAGQAFRWHGLSSVDLKGRLSVPAVYRQTIEARGGGKEILLSKHPDALCIVCYDIGFEAELDRDLREQRKIELERGDSTSFFKRNRGIYSTTSTVSWDSSGRIILPDFLKDRARIDKTALFVAFGAGFEIWDPRTALDQDDDVELRELAAYHLRQKGGES